MSFTNKDVAHKKLFINIKHNTFINKDVAVGIVDMLQAGLGLVISKYCEDGLSIAGL